MSALRELAARAYAVALGRPGTAGIDAIEDAIQAAVNDHTRALADALLLFADYEPSEKDACHYLLCSIEECHNCKRILAARDALRLAGRL